LTADVVCQVLYVNKIKKKEIEEQPLNLAIYRFFFYLAEKKTSKAQKGVN